MGEPQALGKHFRSSTPTGGEDGAEGGICAPLNVSPGLLGAKKAGVAMGHILLLCFVPRH